MAIYRSNTNRTLTIVGVIALVVGLVLGLAAGRLSAPDLASQLAELRAAASPIAGSLEVVRSEYPELVSGGPDTGGATGALSRARSTFDSIRPTLEVVDPDATAVALAALEALEAGVAALEPADDVTSRIEAFSAALDAALGIAVTP